MNDEEKSEQYLKDLKDWQNNMNSPGAYLGGNMPPLVKYGNRRLLKPWAYFGLALITLLIILSAYNFFK